MATSVASTFAAEIGTGAPDFATDVGPILSSNCVRCHGAGRDKGGLRLHSRETMRAGGDSGPVVVPGDPERSELLIRIRLPHEDDDHMPQEAAPLPPASIDVLARWIAAGAEWPDSLRLSPTKTEATRLATLAEGGLLPDTPPVDPAGVAREVDRILAAGNRSGPAGRSLPSAGRIEDLAFLRRATIDLIGRIPTLEEIRTFEAQPPESRRASLVASLLEHPRFNERWSVFFSDMLRVRSNQPGGDRLLAWLHRALTDRMPYDAMARELIAASGRPAENPAVGFILADDADPLALAGATAQIFLGVRLACAECHDHPFDDWSQREFYELAAFFGRTRKVENAFARSTLATDTGEPRVLWPPESDDPTPRHPVDPHFPFELVSTHEGEPPAAFIQRLHARRTIDSPRETGDGRTTDALIDSLLDGDGMAHDSARTDDRPAADVLEEAQREGAALRDREAARHTGEDRARLAELVTDPRNRWFARSFVNRIWFELVGRGFVEPIDDFSAYAEPSHPAVLEFLAREFVASGHDLRHLVASIALTDVYSRGHGDPGLTIVERGQAERAFVVAPVRRMLGELLFDSILVAGHLLDRKWPPGANVRTVTRQVRVPIPDGMTTSANPEGDSDGNQPPTTTMRSEADADADAASAAIQPASGYDLERGLEIDFSDALSEAQSDTANDLESMRRMTERRMAEEAEARRRNAEISAAAPMRYRIETIEEVVDDNPVFAGVMRMATPAPPSHFLRVFGQPGRDGLGESRDHSPSLRQQLMMLNGKAIHEAARVGSLEPLHRLLAGPDADPDAAVVHAYLESLTRPPTSVELVEARALLDAADSPLEGMADLRWALLNSHEFRYLP